MKIALAKSAGFCVGVRRALHIALQAAQQDNVYMLGDIVHNEEVVRKIEKFGVKKVKRLKAGENKTLLIRAHGAPLKIFAQARKLGYSIIDATCAMVKEIHKIVRKSEQRGYRVIVIGDTRHDEVQGISGQLRKKAIVIDSPKHIPLKKLKNIKQAAVVVQSTQNIEQALKIVKILKSCIPEVKFYNTICRPTKTKQEEIKKMPLQNEVMIIIGSKTSANTKRLYQISKSLNRRSYWVQSNKDLRRIWFRKVKNVGVTAGASTPGSTTQSVIRQISNYY